MAQKKFELYQPFLQTFGDLLTPSRNAAASKQLEDVIADFQTFVIVWGSDEVVTAFFRYRVSANVSPPHMVLFRLMADLLMAVRKDVAWPDTKIPNLYTIAMRISDLPQHPEMVEALEMPLKDLFVKEGWTPPFELTGEN